MKPILTALPAALLLLGGCVTVPTGIVDNWVPPQGQTVVTEVKSPLCDKTVGDEAESVTPCTNEVVTLAGTKPSTAVPNGFQRNRPRPPRMRR